jgi:hypothetical protein
MNIDENVVFVQPVPLDTEDVYIDLPTITQQYDDTHYLDIYPQTEIPYFTDNEDDYDDYEEVILPDIMINPPIDTQPDIIIQSKQMSNENREKELFLRILQDFTNRQKEQYLKRPLESTIDLGDRDNILQNIQKQIELKRRFLASKQDELSEYVKTNDFLRHVKKDYAKYNDYITNEKQQQLQAFHTLKQYSEDLQANTQLTEERLKESIRDQYFIVNEINSLKKQLDEYTCPNK